LKEVALQPLQAAANLGTTLVEGAARNLGRLRPTMPGIPDAERKPSPAERMADYLKRKREESQEITAPKTGIGKAASLVSNLAAQALPAVAGGAGAGMFLGGAASAALQAGAGRESSIAGTLSDFIPKSETLSKVAESPALRTAFDTALDLGLAGIGSKVAKVAQAKRMARGLPPKAVAPALDDLAAPAAAQVAEPATGRGAGIAARTLASRPGQSLVTGGTGAVLSQSENEDLKYTGEGLMILAAAHAVGMPRIRAAGNVAGGEIVNALKGHKYGEKLLNTISLDILADPKVKALTEAFNTVQAKGTARAAEFSKMTSKFGPEADRMISDIIEKESISSLTTDDVSILGAAQKVVNEFDNLGKQLVGEGVLAPKAYEKYQGKYLPRVFAEHMGERAGVAPPPTSYPRGRKPEITPYQSRQDLSLEQRGELGEIREASFRASYGIQKGYRNLAAAKLFKGLREMPGALHPEYEKAFDALLDARGIGDDAAILAAKRNLAGVVSEFPEKGAEYVRLKDSPKMGALQGAIVRRDVANYLNGVSEMKGGTGTLLSLWKRVHTVMNLPTHVGNVMSNTTIAHMAGVPVWEQPKAMVAAWKDYGSYGESTRYLAERGILERGLPTAGEAVPRPGHSLKAVLRELAGTTRKETAAVLKAKGIEPMGKLAKVGKFVSDKAEAAYAAEDGAFRVMTFQRLTQEGMDPEKAAAYVDKAFVNYTTRSPLLGAIKNTASPFIMFPVRAIPHIAGEIVENPIRWATLAAIWGGMDQYSQKKVGKIASEDLRPDLRRNKGLGYLAPGFMQLPFKGKDGEKYGLDIARWTPFSALTGSPVPGSLAFGLGGTKLPGIIQPSGPAIDIGAKLTGTDPYTGERIIQPGADPKEKAYAVAGQAAGLVLPSMLSFHAKRIGENVQNVDYRSAAVNSLGLVGLRPQVIKPGVTPYMDDRSFLEARNAIIQRGRRDLRAAKSESRQNTVAKRIEEKLDRLVRQYEEKQPTTKTKSNQQ